MFYTTWLWVAQAIAIVSVLVFILRRLGIPVIESNSTTLMCRSEQAQKAVTQALSACLGAPMRFDTAGIARFLLRDGTSVDWIRGKLSQQAPYEIIGLKQVVLPLFSRLQPFDVAKRMGVELEAGGYPFLLLDQPDPAFPQGTLVILCSSALHNANGNSGSAILIRKNALRMGGPRPTPV